MTLSAKKILFFLPILIMWGFMIRPPVSGGKVTSWYGIRIAHDRIFHVGTDIALPTGAPVNSFSWGTVKETGVTDRDGNYIVISHLPGVISKYLHLNTVIAAEGQKITPLDLIGTVGNTGVSTGSHLHFEIRIFGLPLPPYFLCIPGRIMQKIGAYEFIDSFLGST